MSRGHALLFAIGAVLLLGACRSKQSTVATRHDPTRQLPHRSTERLLEALLAEQRPAPGHYSTKADVELRLPDGNRSVKAHIRCRWDSAAWVSVVPALGIEVARVVLTPDSMKLLDKLHDTYWLGDTGQARTRFGLMPDMQLLQQALLGMPIALDPQEKYRSDREQGLYTLTSREKKRLTGPKFRARGRRPLTGRYPAGRQGHERAPLGAHPAPCRTPRCHHPQVLAGSGRPVRSAHIDQRSGQ